MTKIKRKPPLKRLTAARRHHLVRTFFMLVVTFTGLWCLNNLHFSYYTALFSVWTFVATVTLWLLIIGLCSFPENRQTRNLYHRTSAWLGIEQRGYLCPTADARIYFTDSKVNLSDFWCPEKQRILIFKNGKTNSLAEPIKSKPYLWRWFKVARGEWVSAEYYRVNVEKWKAKRKFIVIDEYCLEKVSASAENLLSFRVWAINFFLCIPCICITVSLLPMEMAYFSKPVWHQYWLVRIVIGWIGLFFVGYVAQHCYNKRVFARILDESKKP